jgi:hypothetical protein
MSRFVSASQAILAAFDALITDKAFDSNVIIAEFDARRQGCHLPASAPCKALVIDEEMYKWRHLIENFFGKTRVFKRIVLHADKTDQRFISMIHLAAAAIASR